MPAITDVFAREILDCRSEPTVEVDLVTTLGVFRSSVPSSVVAGVCEAVELRDDDASRYLGRGTTSAVRNIRDIIRGAITGKDVADQLGIDMLMSEDLDGSNDDWGWAKENLGANAILAVSTAVCRAGAASMNLPLFQYIAHLVGNPLSKMVLPVPQFSMLRGGPLTGNDMPIEEIHLLVPGASSLRQSIQMACEVYQTLKSMIAETYGISYTNVTDNGAFAPPTNTVEEAMDLLVRAVAKAGHSGKVQYCVDVGASNFGIKKGLYDWNYKKRPNAMPVDEYQAEHADGVYNTAELIERYEQLIRTYPICALEDPFSREDFLSFQKVTAKLGRYVQIVGDTLLESNARRIDQSIRDQLCNATLLKINQIGSIAESLQVYKLAQSHGWEVIVSGRSGETDDSFISDFAVGLHCSRIRVGAPCRTDRVAKINQLLRIEESLGKHAIWAGLRFKKSFCPS